MSEEKLNRARSRDDRDLHDLVSSTRQWMEAEGVQEEALDWNDIIRQERALWWRQRLIQAMTNLAANSAGAIGRRLKGLVSAAQSGADVALQVTFETSQKLGSVVSEPARALLRPGVELQMALAGRPTLGPETKPSSLRAKLGGPGRDEIEFLVSTTNISDVHVTFGREVLTLELPGQSASAMVLLISEDQEQTALIGSVSQAGDKTVTTFTDLQPGVYMLCLYIPEQESEEERNAGS